MNYKLDKNLITKFRDKVNSDSYFVCHKYQNIENKNRWNIICSCMDWISVAIRTINYPEQDTNDLDSKTMKVYTYISSIDIIYESINQLHRVLIDRDSIPFSNDKTIFKDNILFRDDNSYFKQIRAIFGAHPVNIEDKNGKWFASWPYSSDTKEYDIQVSLYSNELKKEDIIFGLRFKELKEFLFYRYSYLQKLINEIDSQFKEYCSEKKLRPINKTNNISKQLEILLKESKDRLNNDYYIGVVESLIILFNVQLDSSIKPFEINYKNELQKVVDEVINNLQEMKILDLETHKIVFPDYNNDISYELSKILVFLSEENYDPLLGFYIKRINEYSTNEIELNENDSKEVLFLKIKIIMYYKMWK